MRTPTARRLIGFALITAALALPTTASATIRGGCQGTGTTSSGGAIDLTTATEWHMLSTDTAGGSGTAPSEQTEASVGAYALGIRLPITEGSGSGKTVGSVDGVSVELYAILGHRFVVAGESAGEGGGCDGEVTVILDDVDPLFTLLGGGGILASVIAIIVLFGLARGGGGCVGRVLGGMFGGLGGIGLGLGLEQFGVVDPTEPIGLLIAIVGLVLGLWTPGRLFGGGGAGSADSGSSGGSLDDEVPDTAIGTGG